MAKAMVQVVKYNGTPDVFAWKYPSEELGNWTQVVVNESQEAILFKGGQALDSFGPGTHTLKTENIPLLRKVVNIPFGGESPFKAEIWYINLVASLDIKWGTSSPIQLQDPKFGIFIPVRSFGQFGIRITDPRMFLQKLVGTLPQFGKTDVMQFFRGLYLTKVKDAISSYLVHKQVGILEINAYLEELSGFMRQKLEPTLAEYGIGLINFFVNDISVPEDDPGVVKLKEALSKRAEMDIIGFDYTQQRSFDTLEGAAKNPGAGNIAGAGIGLGLGVAVGGAVGGQMGGIASNISTAAAGAPCPRCNQPVPAGKRFCPDCGHDIEAGEAKEDIQCSKCGKKLDPTKRFCPHCGDPYNPCPGCAQDIDEGAAQCPKCGYQMPTPCPGCGAPVASKVKFCPECGQGLEKKCAKCDAVIEGSPKFCPECGEKQV